MCVFVYVCGHCVPVCQSLPCDGNYVGCGNFEIAEFFLKILAEAWYRCKMRSLHIPSAQKSLI